MARRATFAAEGRRAEPRAPLRLGGDCSTRLRCHRVTCLQRRCACQEKKRDKAILGGRGITARRSQAEENTIRTTSMAVKRKISLFY